MGETARGRCGWWRSAVAVTAVGCLAAAGGCADDSAPAAGGAGSAPPATTVRSGELVALTYNVAGLPEGMSSSNPSVNTPLISPRLNAFDLVVVQEDWLAPAENPFGDALTVFHDVLAADADHPYRSDPAPLPLGSDPARPDALVSDGLNRFSRSPFGPITREVWPGCFGGITGPGAGDCLSEKGFSVATHTLAEGVEVDVYNLHAEAGSTDEDQRLQTADFERLAAFVTEHSAGRAVVLAGDTNLHTGGEHADGRDGEDTGIWQAFLAATGLTDACAALDCPFPERIDKFAFRSGGGVDLEVTDLRFLADEFVRDDGEPLSDHDPLRATFRWSAA